MATSVYDFTLKDIRGTPKPLGDYRGKVLLLVNVASRCGLTPQYEGLQKLYEKYHERGLEILAFPANNFLAQEPGTNDEILSFCQTNYHVSFPLFAKISVKGDDIDPLYKYLTTEAPHAGEIKWNFHKFLVDRNGQVVANIDPRKEPAELEDEISKYI